MKKNKGYTLIELVIVVGFLALLSISVFLFFKNADALFKNSETESELLGYLEAKQTTK